MRSSFYPKLACQNIVKNKRFYFPYLITCVFTIAMFYDLLFIVNNKGIGKIHGGDILQVYLNLGAWIVAIFSVIFLFYTNSFLIKSRKKELGLYNILGMSKLNIAHVLIWETFITAVLTFIIGILFGIVVSKLMLLLLCYIMKFNVQLGFSVSLVSIKFTAVLFAAIFLVTLIFNLFCIRLSKPVELLRGGNVGEKEPKAKWFMAALGVLSLGAAYYIALTVEDPVTAIVLFFIAVLLVIFGTYTLFISGSIAILKLLRKKKSYYYKPNHFTSISGMLYRMKQNAAGLASICILSTMVLVMISGTVCLNIGAADILEGRAPYDFTVTYKADGGNIDKAAIKELIKTQAEKKQLAVDEKSAFEYIDVTLTHKDNKLNFYNREKEGRIAVSACVVGAMSVDQYNSCMGENKSLSKGEAMGCYISKEKKTDTIDLAGKNLKMTWVKKVPTSEKLMSYATDVLCIVMNNDDFNEFYQAQKSAYKDDASPLVWEYSGNLGGTVEQRTDFCNDLYDIINKDENLTNMTSRDIIKTEYYNAYGGLFFIGIFLGTLFIGFTALIIYYKQISEGYDDKQRFEIMQKVGMSKAEVKKSINSQVLKVFFLPLLAAVMHLAFAYKIITKLLSLLGLMNGALFIACIIGTVAVFALIYFFIYYFTAKTYYKIVNS